MREERIDVAAAEDESSEQQDVLLCEREGQHQILEKVTADFGLTEEELDWLRRAAMPLAAGPRRLDPKIYRAASAFETLVGYLYYVDQTRLEQLLQFSLDAAEEVIRVDGEAASSSSSDSDTAER